MTVMQEFSSDELRVAYGLPHEPKNGAVVHEFKRIYDEEGMPLCTVVFSLPGQADGYAWSVDYYPDKSHDSFAVGYMQPAMLVVRRHKTVTVWEPE